MPRFLPYVPGTLLVLLLLTGPAGYTYHGLTQVRNFHAVRDGVLYRSGQMSLAGLKEVLHDFGIKTVVSLRDSAYANEPPPDLAEQSYCEAACIHYCRISPRTWWAPDGSVPAEEGVRRFREVMDHPENYPVLIHCFGGIHRTGAFCAVYRMEYEHWSNADAIAEMRACGYKDLDDEWDLLGYLEQYRPRWQEAAPEEKPLAPSRQAGRPRRSRGVPHIW